MAISNTSLMTLKLNGLVAMGADSRITAGRGGVLDNSYNKIHRIGENIFMGFSGYAGTFEAVTSQVGYPNNNNIIIPDDIDIAARWIRQTVNDHLSAFLAPLRNNVARLQKESRIHSVNLFVIRWNSVCVIYHDPIFGSPWNHSIRETQNIVECLGSGTRRLYEYCMKHQNSVNGNMSEDEMVDFVEGAIEDVCRNEWCTGGDIHVVVLAPYFTRKLHWKPVNQEDCRSGYKKEGDTREMKTYTMSDIEMAEMEMEMESP